MKISAFHSIQKPNLLLVEGDDEEYFLEEFFRVGGVDTEIVNCCGSTNISAHVKAITKITGFNSLRKFGVVRDADTSYTGSLQSVTNALTQAGLTAPLTANSLSTGQPQTAIFIMPAANQPGMLEDLCLASVQTNPLVACVDNFLDCVKKRGTSYRVPSKSRAQAFLAAMPDSVPNVGIAAKRKYWDFQSPVLDQLGIFRALFS